MAAAGQPRLTTWLKSGELLDTEGQKWLPERGPDVPILVFGGAVDKVIPLPNVAAACDVFPECRFVWMGTEGGFATDYGHVDPVMGTPAPTEIYPLVEAFLAERVAADLAAESAEQAAADE